MDTSKKKIRILYIITRLVSGGAAKIILTLVKNLPKDLFQVDICFGLEDLEHYYIEEFRKLGIKLYPVKHLVRNPSPLKDIKALFAIGSIISRNRYDIIHTHTSKAGVLGRLTGKLTGRGARLIHTPHGHIFDKQANIPGVKNNKFILNFFYLLERISSIFTWKITTLTEKERQELINLKMLHPKNIITIYDAIENHNVSSKDPKLIKQALGIPDDAYILSVIGRLSREKGQIVALQALKELENDSSDKFILLIIGEGGDLGFLIQKTKELNIEKYVMFLGQQKNVFDFIAISDIVIVPSFYEGFSLVILEAFSQKKVVIAANVGGIPEILKDNFNGLLFERGNYKELAKKILTLKSNQKLALQLGINGYETYKNKFSLEKMIDSFKNLYCEILY